jgi:ABC-type glycerol-3-phosphate transport system substrate-binding protein
VDRPWSRLRRREALRAGAGLAVVAGGAALAGCASSAAGTTAPSTPAAQGGVVDILFNANVQDVSWNKTTRGLYQQFVDEHFNSNPKYRGIRATVTANNGQGNAAAQVTASIAGSGYPDILEGCCSDFPTYFSGGWLIPLDDYIKESNIDTSIWSKRHMQALNIGGQQLGIPAYDGTVQIVYRQDILDSLGIPYPDPSWTLDEAQRIWTQCAGTVPGSKQHRYGVSVYFHTDDWQKLHFWLQGWGGEEADASGTVALVDRPPAVAAMTWMQQMVQSQVLTGREDVTPLMNGTAVFSMCGVWTLFTQATGLGSKFKWNTLPVPNWPNGRSTYNNIDFYGINKASKHPAHAWELLRWLQAETEWQRFLMQVELVTPALLSLWPQWETTVTSVAPTLKGKNVNYYYEALQQNYSWPAEFFRYDAPAVISTIDNWADQLWSLKVTAQDAMQQMAAQINSIQSLGPTLAAAQASAKANFPTQGPPLAPVVAGI